MYYVYLLKSVKDGQLYIGSTDDLKRRFEEHNTGKSPSTRHRIPLELIYYEAYKAKSDAIRREIHIKRFNQGYTNLKKRITDSLVSWESGGRKVRTLFGVWEVANGDQGQP